MKLSDYPPEACCDLLYSILDRYHSAKERWSPFKGIKTEVHLSLDDARLVFAAGQWLQRYDTWEEESRKAKGKIGVYPADHSLKQCVTFLTEVSKTFSKDSIPVITLSEKHMGLIDSAVRHLDHYHLMLSFINDKKRYKR